MLTRGRLQIAGAGVTLLTIALGFFASAWPELIRPHPYWLAISGLIGVLLIVAPLFWPNADSLDVPYAKGGLIVGRDNSAQNQIFSHGDVYIGKPFDSASGVRETKTVPDAPQVEEKRLDLKLTAHGDNDTSIYLEVSNRGATATVDAQLRIIGLSTGKKFKTFPFSGQWRSELTTIDFYNGESESYVSSVRIEANKSRLLKVATITSMMGFEEQEMALVGIDDESIVWNSHSRQNQELPYFVVQITLIAKGYPKTIDAKYKVGPKTPQGPFQMTEVAA